MVLLGGVLAAERAGYCPRFCAGQVSGQRQCRRSGGCVNNLQLSWRGCFLESPCSCKDQKLPVRSRRAFSHSCYWLAALIWWLVEFPLKRAVRKKRTEPEPCSRWCSSTPPPCCGGRCL